jgi:hypothetical protein
MASIKPIAISLKARIPELKDLPLEEASSILQKCISAEPMLRFSKQYMFYFRIVLGGLFIVMLLFLGMTMSGYPMFFRAWLSTMALALLSLPGHMVLFHILSGRLLRQLIRREMAARKEII